MAVISINKKLFEKEIGKLNEKMQDRIAMFGTPVEEIDAEEIQIEVFPNRPDLLSYQGFKRSFLAFLGKKEATGLKQYKLNKPGKDYKVVIERSLKNIRPCTACGIVRNLKFNDEKIKEIIDIQEKLHVTIGRKRKKVAIGIYPLEKIKLPITFKALEPDKINFIPLESDVQMSGLDILQKHPVGRDYSHLLAGKAKFPIFIDAAENILSMPPIINSQLTGKITEQTKEVFIECSGFDLSMLKKCLNILVTVLADMGGQIYQMTLDYRDKKTKKETTPSLSPEKMKISLANTNKLLGLNLDEKQLKSLIEKMGHEYKNGNVSIPAWRVDILHEVDLIEDVAIAYGYDNFIPEIPKISTIGQEDPKEIIKRKISEMLASLNMLEISNYHLTNKNDQFKKMGADGKSEKQKTGFVEVEESKTDYKILRKNLCHYLLKILSENVDVEYPQKIFETGRIFSIDEDKKNKINETESLAAAICPGNFTEIKQTLIYLSRIMDIKMELKEPDSDESNNIPQHFIDGRVAEILINDKNNKNKSIGFLGEIHPKILKNWRIKMPVALFEISLDEIFEMLK